MIGTNEFPGMTTQAAASLANEVTLGTLGTGGMGIQTLQGNSSFMGGASTLKPSAANAVTQATPTNLCLQMLGTDTDPTPSAVRTTLTFALASGGGGKMPPNVFVQRVMETALEHARGALAQELARTTVKAKAKASLQQSTETTAATTTSKTTSSMSRTSDFKKRGTMSDDHDDDNDDDDDGDADDADDDDEEDDDDDVTTAQVDRMCVLLRATARQRDQGLGPGLGAEKGQGLGLGLGLGQRSVIDMGSSSPWVPSMSTINECIDIAANAAAVAVATAAAATAANAVC